MCKYLDTKRIVSMLRLYIQFKAFKYPSYDTKKQLFSAARACLHERYVHFMLRRPETEDHLFAPEYTREA